MVKAAKCYITILGVILSLASEQTQASSSREFLMSAGYGVLAGTMVGAASLAFSDRPGDNLNRVARGASFGLYAGILLGLYVVYGVPSAEEQELRDQLGSIQVIPILDSRGRPDGAEVKMAVLEF